MTLRYHDLYKTWSILTVVLIGTLVAGCGGGNLNGGDNGKASYTLEVVAEKNLGNDVDYLHIRFLKDGITVVNGYVMVNGDSLSLTASGVAFTTYPGSHFPHSEPIDIEAVDPAEGFVYVDSVIMPSTVSAAVSPEADSIWVPAKGAITIEFTLASPVAGYILSVTPRTPSSPAPGFADDATTGQFASFLPADAFYDLFTNQLVSDRYDARIIAYNGTFLPRPSSPYVFPARTYPLTVDTDQITGRISAQVISNRATVEAKDLSQ